MSKYMAVTYINILSILHSVTAVREQRREVDDEVTSGHGDTTLVSQTILWRCLAHKDQVLLSQ